jgi:tetratricopeptide (TPR) repeat protein
VVTLLRDEFVEGTARAGCNVNFQQIESLLKQAIEYDPNLADARLQLGNLYSNQRKYADAIPLYEHALELNSVA